jgi:hypothetical protein
MFRNVDISGFWLFDFWYLLCQNFLRGYFAQLSAGEGVSQVCESGSASALPAVPTGFAFQAKAGAEGGALDINERYRMQNLDLP